MAVTMGTMAVGTATAILISVITPTSVGLFGMGFLSTTPGIPVTLPSKINPTIAPKTTLTIRVDPPFLIGVGRGSARMSLR